MTIDINGDVIDEITIDGEFTEEVTVDGDVVFQQSAIPDSGVMRLTFDDADTESGTALDVWNNNDGTINGATTGISGANQTYTTNEAYSFDGADDYIDIGNLISSGSQSFAIWVNPDTVPPSDRKWIYGADDTSSGLFSLVLEADGTLTFAGRSGKGVLNVSNNLSAGSWSHITATHDASVGDWVLYEDGQEISSVSGDGTYASIATDYGICAKLRDSSPNANRYFLGDADDARLYNKKLSASEVSNLYNNGSI